MDHEASMGSASLRPHPRARRRAETLEELLDRAEQVVLAEGLESLSMHRLAAEHGVRVAALYRYWPSKDALLGALLARTVERVREKVALVPAWVDEVARRTRYDGRQRALLYVARLGAVYVELSRERPETTALMTHFLGVALLREVASALAAASEVGALAEGDAIERAALLWTSLHGLVAASKLTRFGVAGTAERLTELLLATLLRGWGAEPGVLARPLARALRP
jgi:AcrR family transcriptional regulator